MRAYVAYDRDGTIAGLAICPPDGPALFPTVGPGQLVTEVDLPEGAVDFDDEQRAMETLREFRVDVAAKLVRR